MELLTASLLQSLSNQNSLVEFTVKFGEKEYKLFTRKPTAQMKQEYYTKLKSIMVGDGDSATIDAGSVRDWQAWRVSEFVCDDKGNKLFSIEQLMQTDDDMLTAIDEASSKVIESSASVEQEAKN